MFRLSDLSKNSSEKYLLSVGQHCTDFVQY
ncbi:MAG: hypothetical protein CDV28_11354 [Candidatus Electronema aureum]|uniref:Uncharacterized protein n=1 Tax=Candidatus Electronema aureum TaxID=2005002 RepID=A0A521G1Y7_9BACT|nr:MAG: hypothetical protein CDV28_11354 [Candidatus Electronema aureum]